MQLPLTKSFLKLFLWIRWYCIFYLSYFCIQSSVGSYVYEYDVSCMWLIRYHKLQSWCGFWLPAFYWGFTIGQFWQRNASLQVNALFIFYYDVVILWCEARRAEVERRARQCCISLSECRLSFAQANDPLLYMGFVSLWIHKAHRCRQTSRYRKNY